MAAVFLNDDAGNTWQLSVNNQSQVVATLVAHTPGAPLIIREWDSAVTNYELRITGGGFLSVFLSSNTQHIGPTIFLQSFDLTVSLYLRVFHGIVQTSGDATFAKVIQVGQLLPGDGCYPTPLQPGGPGTPVTMPSQTEGEMIGLWVAGCTHWFNHWSVYSAEIGGQPTALICCPICLYIQRIVIPYSAIHTDQNAIIFA